MRQPKKPKPKNQGPTASSPKKQLDARDRRIVDAWERYRNASIELLRATDSATLGAATLKANASLARLDQARRQRRQSGPKSNKVPKPGRSKSIRTVSGGAPGLGKRR
ncbi:hypothetical protein [Actinomarinicola tropica]|uniref:Uncharacterized protein n=1 Tax=Actinomarinicola tropica TaxID=2789776 RepID=A0A5Q2RHL0_9ACTN|nr:hypothetical protein [Actinomarinicola tropica]QGG94362.1 hypothetical protein GH723_04170 [Actinomarinicola tropica]